MFLFLVFCFSLEFNGKTLKEDMLQIAVALQM